MPPKVFNGCTGEPSDQTANVRHVTLPPGKTVDLGIVNIFEQSSGDTLTFFQDGFACKAVAVNGVKETFAASHREERPGYQAPFGCRLLRRIDQHQLPGSRSRRRRSEILYTGFQRRSLQARQGN